MVMVCGYFIFDTRLSTRLDCSDVLHVFWVCGITQFAECQFGADEVFGVTRRNRQ